MKVKYSWLPGGMVPFAVLEECSMLYSKHYGIWSEEAPFAAGKTIRLSAERIKAWLENNSANLYQARVEESLIAYAIAIRLKERDYGLVSWVTQLVVHEKYRNIDVAKALLFSIWGLSNHFAWGLVTANPYAVRALEKATRRRCLPARIYRNRKKLLKIGKDNLPYIHEGTTIEVGKSVSRINTEFFVDHDKLAEMVRAASSDSVPWLLGGLEEGWEWFAFTFNDQAQLDLTKDEIETMISASDEVTKRAYSRMALDGSHKWLSHTSKEVDFIVEVCELKEGQSVLDVGCGTGRHCIELAKRGLNTMGIDYISDFTQSAENRARQLGIATARFQSSDFRLYSHDGKYDAVICLYDVVGSFVDESDNQRILSNIASSVKRGGFVLLSVMNYELTANKAKQVFSFEKEPNRLLDLPSAEIMERTGDVFNPDYYLVDDSTHVVYRKEQFTYGDELPTELIVRDRRYTKDEIVSCCEDSGLEVKWAKYVGAGKWVDSLDSHNRSAKEILVLCKRPANAKAC